MEWSGSLIPLKFLDNHHNRPKCCGHTIVIYLLLCYYIVIRPDFLLKLNTFYKMLFLSSEGSTVQRNLVVWPSSRLRCTVVLSDAITVTYLRWRSKKGTTHSKYFILCSSVLYLTGTNLPTVFSRPTAFASNYSTITVRVII